MPVCALSILCNSPCHAIHYLNTLRPIQNGRHFSDDVFKYVLLIETIEISMNISLKFVIKVPINNIPTMVQIMAWRRKGDKPLSETMIVSWKKHAYFYMHQYMDVWVSNPEPAASSVVVRYKCIKLYISATIQPIQMNEHSFYTIWNVPDRSVAINAIMCKVMTLLFHMHINRRLYIFRKKRTYCYILFSKPQRNTPFKLLLTPKDSHENYLSTHISKCMIIWIWRSHMHQYIDVWVSNPKPAASSVVVRYKCIKLYISATIQPIQMNEHSFCTIWNVPDGSIVINAIINAKARGDLCFIYCYVEFDWD